MKFPMVNFKEANQNLTWIIAVGVALGVGNYALGIWPTLGQSLVQQVSISLVIGYFLILIAGNYALWFSENTANYKKYILLIILFILVGIVGTEIDGLVRAYAFQQHTFIFLQLNGIHVFNSIISIILGFVTLSWAKSRGVEKIIKKEVKKIDGVNL